MTPPRISRAEYGAIERRITVLRGEDVQATQELADATHNGSDEELTVLEIAPA